MGDLGDYVRDFDRNIREFKGPLAEKIRLIIRNRAIASVRGCCGHHGEPGC